MRIIFCLNPFHSSTSFHHFFSCILLLSGLMCFSHTGVHPQQAAGGSVRGQASRKTTAKPALPIKTTVTGLLYFGGDGQGIRTCLLKTANGVIEFSVTKRTKAINFPELDDVGWNLGAEWRVTYHKSKDLALGFEADSITYLATNHTIDSAYNLAREFVTAFSGEIPDLKQAYSKLSPALQRRLSLAGFETMFLDVQFDYGHIRVCSHSDGKVVLMLAYMGELAHRVEIVESDADSDFEFRINRFFNWSETLAREEALCRKM